MLRRLSFVSVLMACFTASAAAQVVRFETTVGDVEMVLNPTNNPLLGDYVDNFVNYVDNSTYNGSWINRADTGFVLQMGGFYSHTRRPPPTQASIRPVAPFAPVPGQPAAEIGLSNTVGTVALALPGDGMGGTNEDAGTSSFFVNLTSNSFLDADFTVFAAIPDMTVVNQIMALMTIDRTQDPVFDADPGNLAFTDVPVADNGHQVFIKRAFLVQDTMSIARARAGIESTMAMSASAFNGGSSFPELSAMAVPEPASGMMLLVGAAALLGLFGRRR
jgi:cyclophilin family peptidyl-prolyl cis-trans isomerase